MPELVRMCGPQHKPTKISYEAKRKSFYEAKRKSFYKAKRKSFYKARRTSFYKTKINISRIIYHIYREKGHF